MAPVVGALTPTRSRTTAAGGTLRTPRWLWVIAVAVLVPTLVPFLSLLVRVAGAGGEVTATVLSARTLELLFNTVILVGLVTASAVAVGVGAAWLVTLTDVPGRRIWAVLVALPLVIPSYVVALALRSAFGPRGLFAELTGFAFPVVGGLPGAWLALTIATYPFVFLVAAAALRRVDAHQEEAARGLGASPSRVLRTIVMPQLRPAIGASALLVSLYTLSDFGAVSLMRFDSFTRMVYAQYAGRLDRTPAAVLAVLLVMVALAILVLEERTRGKGVTYSLGGAIRPRLRRLTVGARAASEAALALLAGVALVLPMGVLVAWLARGSGAELDWGAVAGSLSGSTVAALLAGTAAIPVAVLAVRHSSTATVWLERTAYAVFALPHITVALAVVYFASGYLGGLYQSLTLLVLVYASIFFAQALGAGRAAVQQVDPHLEEASRGLGRGPLSTMVRVVVPLVWPGLAAGAALVFLTTMKELPATLLLRPTGFDTLAVDIWSAADELLYARAAAPALLLVAVSAVPMYLLASRDR